MFADSENSDSSEYFVDSDGSESSEQFAQESIENSGSDCDLHEQMRAPTPAAVRTDKFQPLPCKLYVKQKEIVQPNLNPVENVCQKKCKNNCSEFVSKMTEEDKIQVINQFKAVTKIDSKNKLLMHLKSQKVMGLDVASFTFKSHTYCVAAFCHVTGISFYLAAKVLKDFQAGINQYIHGSTVVPRASFAHVNFISWMVCFCELHGQSDPVKVTTVLPAFLNKAELFKIYKAEAPKPNLKPSTFYCLMRKKFGVSRSDKSLPNIRISKYSTHSKCDICAGIDNFKSTSKSQTELEFSRALKYKHCERVREGIIITKHGLIGMGSMFFTINILG